MATFFKSIEEKDITTTRDLLHESVPMTSSMISGTYGLTNTVHEFPNEENIKNYNHGLYQSVYDFPYASASSNHLFDLTTGYSTASVHVHSGDPLPDGDNAQNNDKINIYNQMAQTLVGLDHTGSIKEFRIPDGDAIREAYFIVFNRALVKDEIKKGSLTMSFGTGSVYANASDPPVAPRIIYDDDESYYSDSPAGDYSKLQFSTAPTAPSQNKPCGLIYYQAGVIVLSASMFFPYSSTTPNTGENYDNDGYLFITGSEKGNRGVEDDNVPSFRHILTSGSITGSTNALRHRINKIEFSNTTELNATTHFCRLNYNEFNYSSNPTYVSSSKIQVRHDPAGNIYSNKLPAPSAYITTIGLYGPDNSLLAVAKLSKPLKKSPSEDITLKVRLDY